MQIRKPAQRRTAALTPDWIDIRLGPRRELNCSCPAGGRAIDLPSGVGRDSFGRNNGFRATGTCNHIEALYRGNVTEDKRVATDDEYRIAYEGDPAGPRRLIQLTKLGERMFRWRWAQMALERST